jgi:hypothetical protein
MPAKSRRAPNGTPRPTPKARRGPGIRLTLVDRYQLLELHKAHPEWSYRELAAQAGCNETTARITCIAATKSAADLMSAYAAPALMQWLKAMKVAATRGDHRPTKDWLMHAGSIDPLPESQRNAGPSIVIVNTSLPGLPTGQPVITIDTVTTARQEALSVTKGNNEPDQG